MEPGCGKQRVWSKNWCSPAGLGRGGGPGGGTGLGGALLEALVGALTAPRGMRGLARGGSAAVVAPDRNEGLIGP